MIAWMLRSFAVGVLFLVVHGAQALFGGGLPWWGSLTAAAAGYVACAFVIKSLFFRAVTAPFEAKGAPLRGAKLEVHSVTAVNAPARERKPAMACAGGGGGEEADDDCCEHEEVAPGWKWYCIDATVKPPAMGTGPFRAWEPGEMMIVPADAATSPGAPTTEDRASIRMVEVFDDGEFMKDEGFSFQGEQRLRFTVACDPGLQAAKLRYYFEGFGRIELPR